MAGYLFLDSTALVKHYHPEEGTERLDDWLRRPGCRYVISLLAVVEVHSAFARKVREKVLSEHGFQFCGVRFFYDQLNGLFSTVPVEATHFYQAQRLIQEYGPTQRLRSLDAVQIAVALDCRESGLADYFVSSDTNQLRVAEHHGFSILNPQDPSSVLE